MSERARKPFVGRVSRLRLALEMIAARAWVAGRDDLGANTVTCGVCGNDDRDGHHARCIVLIAERALSVDDSA